MAEFIGRREELETLESGYSGAGSAFVPIYGRRRWARAS
jgi:AAA+ ATPase superfamily predicted ATPase